MSILVDKNTRLIVQGITGREGTFHTEQMLEYGTNVVAGVTPGKGGQTVLGVPVFNTVREAAEETGANASVIFVPAMHMMSGALEAIDAGLPLVITIAEHVPVQDMMRVYHYGRLKGTRVIGPNSFGVISPGKSKAGFMAHRIFLPGHVGLMSRSATNCYETVFMLTNAGIGQSTCVGIGGDMIAGSSFSDLLPLFEEDPETKAIVMIGEIGLDERTNLKTGRSADRREKRAEGPLHGSCGRDRFCRRDGKRRFQNQGAFRSGRCHCRQHGGNCVLPEKAHGLEF